jgi:hypothetical protein
VQRTGRHDKPDRTQLIERSSKLAAERRGRVDQQAAGAKPDHHHVPAHLQPKESERRLHEPQAAVQLGQHRTRCPRTWVTSYRFLAFTAVPYAQLSVQVEPSSEVSNRNAMMTVALMIVATPWFGGAASLPAGPLRDHADSWPTSSVSAG